MQNSQEPLPHQECPFITISSFNDGNGCSEEPGCVQHLIVAHIIGDFLPLWPFVKQFADYLIIEDTPIGVNPTLPQLANDVASKINNYTCVRKPSVDDKRCQESIKYGFRHLHIEGQLEGKSKTYKILRSIIWLRFAAVKSRLALCDMSVLIEEVYCIHRPKLRRTWRNRIFFEKGSSRY